MDSVIKKLIKAEEDMESSIQALLSGTKVPDFSNMDIVQYKKMHVILERYCDGVEQQKTLRELKPIWDKAFMERKAGREKAPNVRCFFGNYIVSCDNIEDENMPMRLGQLSLVVQIGDKWIGKALITI